MAAKLTGRNPHPRAAIAWWAAAALALAGVAAGVDASAAADPPANGGSPAMAADPHLGAAEAAAGTRWKDAYLDLCGLEPPVMVGVNDENIRPQRIFDNLAIVGDRGTVMFALSTSMGTVLIDAGFSSKTDVLLAGLKSLGIDPSSVKYLIVTHGHPDHFGAAPYFQQTFGTHIVASDADWELIAHPDAHLLPPKPEPWMTAPGPTRDIVVGDGGEVVLGKLEVETFLIPGHTPGALGLIFPVYDHGAAHTAAIFGGTILAAGRISNDGLRQYIASLAHFGEATRRRHVDVELQNHPVFDGTWQKLALLNARESPREPNPFVIGSAAYQSFLTVISECTQHTLAQRPIAP